jgi:hypothetical protein
MRDRVQPLSKTDLERLLRRYPGDVAELSTTLSAAKRRYPYPA